MGRGVAEWLAKPRPSDAVRTFQKMMMDGLGRATGRPNIISRTSHPKLSVHTSLEIEGEGPTSNRTFFFKLVTWPGSMEYPNFEREKIRKARREALVATTFYCRAGSTVTIFAPRTKCWLKFCLGPDDINDMVTHSPTHSLTYSLTHLLTHLGSGELLCRERQATTWLTY
jgi:hypothetical protein